MPMSGSMTPPVLMDQHHSTHLPHAAIARPNLNSHVFLTVTENQDQVLVDPEEEPFDLEEGTQHIMRYGPVAPLVNSSAVKLI
eukprot:gene12476-3156_t